MPIHLETDLLPHLNGNSVLVMDNMKSHHAKAVKELLDSSGVRYIYLQPYSPDLNPIEKLCRWSGRGIAGPSVLAEHLIKTAFNLLFPLFLFLRREYRRKTFQHNAFPLKMDGFGFTLISNGLYH